MRSPGSAARERRVAEWTFRIIAVAALLALALDPSLIAPRAPASRAAPATPDALAAWTLSPRDTVAVAQNTLPEPAARAWLAALARAGAVVRWRVDSAAPLAIAAEPAPDPAGGFRVMLATAAPMPVALSDAAGPVDSVADASGLVALRTSALEGAIAGATAHQVAHAAEPGARELRRILVLGRAGWESKFTIAALEERGWAVDARLVVAPDAVVDQGAWSSPDTARHAAAVVLDSTGARLATRLIAYARDGGGLVIAGEATRHRAFAPILPGRAGPVRTGSAAAVRSDSLGMLGRRFPVIGLKDDAVVLESDGDGGGARVAARRERAGRIVQVADAESWRRRMAPAAGSVERHREWWARVVAAAAYAPPAVLPRFGDAAAPDPFPFAATRMALGDQAPPALPEPSPRRDLAPILFALIMTLLLLEWASRRLRGAR